MAPGSDQIHLAVIDDSPLVLDLLAMLARRHDGVSVVAGVDGEGDSIETVTAARPHIVLVDHNLRSTLGTDLLPELRRVCPTAMIVMFSSDEDVAELADAAGADGFYAKDVQMTRLMSRLLHDYEQRRRGRGGAAEPAPQAELLPAGR
jgi:DNA-binding NarL/FixJ family response regulator